MDVLTNCQAIMCVVNAGFGDAVMDAAKEFGARGGTVIHARGTANSEAEKLENKSIYEILSEAGIDTEKLSESFLNIYVSFIEKHAEEFIKNFRISEIVEEKVNQMDVLMLEELMMSIMKKELNAVVNLGALIGLVIGTVNILF